MIIQNGFIEAKEKVVGGIDPATGFPIKAANSAYSAPIPCQYTANTYNQLGRVNGEHFTIAHYSILIEQQPSPFIAEQVRLKDMDGRVIGEYSVMSAETLDAVCEIRLIV